MRNLVRKVGSLKYLFMAEERRRQSLNLLDYPCQGKAPLLFTDHKKTGF